MEEEEEEEGYEVGTLKAVEGLRTADPCLDLGCHLLAVNLTKFLVVLFCF